MNFENIQFDFKITSADVLFCYTLQDKTTAECVFDGNSLTFSVLYSFNEDMLKMSSCANMGDNVSIKILPYRLELYINGKLCDEEWQCGDNYLEKSTLSHKNTHIDFLVPETVDKNSLPSVLYTFKNAEGWRPDENIFAGDCMPYVHDGRYHVIYLYDRHHHKSKWRKGAHQWAHISTDDFDTWQTHPMMVEITEKWEGSICTGSHICKNGIHYLFYTVRTCDGSPAPISRSISTDGYHFEKDKDYHFELSDKYMSSSARDPKIIQGEDGLYHMIITTGLSSDGKGCLAHLVSHDLDKWVEEENPIYISPDDNQPECPDYFKLGEYYYLIFSHRSIGQYLYSKEPFTGWKKPDIDKIPCESVPKCAVLDGKIIFSGYKGLGGYAGTLTFKTAHQSENGLLVFE